MEVPICIYNIEVQIINYVFYVWACIIFKWCDIMLFNKSDDVTHVSLLLNFILHFTRRHIIFYLVLLNGYPYDVLLSSSLRPFYLLQHTRMRLAISNVPINSLKSVPPCFEI